MSGTWHHGKPGPPKRGKRRKGKGRSKRPWQDTEQAPIERLEREIVGKKPGRRRRPRRHR